MTKRPDGTYYVSPQGRYITSSYDLRYDPPRQVLVGWNWRVYVARDHGGDRWVCDASSEKTARQIAKALNDTRPVVNLPVEPREYRQ